MILLRHLQAIGHLLKRQRGFSLEDLLGSMIKWSLMRGVHYTGRNQQTGQAAIEFVAALFLILLIVIGLTHLARLSSKTIDLAAKVRAEGGMAALAGGLAQSPRFIADWGSGSDQKMGTADDQPRMAGINSLNTILSAAGSDYAPAENSLLDFSPSTVYRTGDTALGIGLVHREAKADVTVDNFIRQTVYDKPEIRLFQEIWMPNMEFAP